MNIQTTLTFTDRVVSGIFVFSLQFLLLVSRRVPSSSVRFRRGGGLELLGVTPLVPRVLQGLYCHACSPSGSTLCWNTKPPCALRLLFLFHHRWVALCKVPSSLFSVFPFLRLKSWFEMDVRFLRHFAHICPFCPPSSTQRCREPGLSPFTTYYRDLWQTASLSEFVLTGRQTRTTAVRRF